MELIFSCIHPLEVLGTIQIFKPSRGIGGTLAYIVKVGNLLASFEIDDNGNWQTDLLNDDLNLGLLTFLRELINILEKERLRNNHPLHP